jgi:hypothetical protein
MNEPSALAIPKLETVRLEQSSPDSVKLAGMVKDRETIAELSAFFRAAHAQALRHRVTQMKVDVSELTFVSASAIRLFVDWVGWVNEEARPYKLRFLTSRFIAWQKSTFQGLSGLTTDVLEVAKID